jgi:hypothetical protein
MVSFSKYTSSFWGLILAKSLILSEKNYYNHRAPMQWNDSFWPKFHLFFTIRLDGSIRYSRTKHSVHSYLRNRTTAQTEYLMGSTVNNLLKFWVCKLSFLKRHPSNQKGKIMKQHALLQWKEKKILPLNQPCLSDWSNTERRLYHTQFYLRIRTNAHRSDLFGILSCKFGEVLSI